MTQSQYSEKWSADEKLLHVMLQSLDRNVRIFKIILH